MFSSTAAKSNFLRHFKAGEVARALGPDDAPKTPDHSAIPLPLIYLRDRINLAPVTFYEAIPVNADLASVIDHFLYWLLSVELKTYAVVKPVAELYRRKLAGETVTKKEWQVAAATAAAVATVAAVVAAVVATAEAAAAEAAAAAAAEAAWAARAARAAAYERMREALLGLLRGGACSCCGKRR